MRKLDEIALPSSCLNRARDDEYLFVLLGRDIASPGTIRDWVRRRIALGKNKPDDPQMLEALETAAAIDAELCQCHRCLDQRDARTVSGQPIFEAIMILCPTCGNKRCPHASDHNLACTNSNMPGQRGSLYTSI